MRLATVRTGTGTRAARVEDEELVLLGAPDVGALLAGGSDWREAAAAGEGERMPLSGAALAPVIPWPEKIICSGLNYGAHAEEIGQPIPEYPTLFAKYARALVGPHDPIVLPASSTGVDWEAELGVVVGKRVRHADEQEAVAAIAGYVAANDVSMRDWQKRSREWLQGKTFEATTPIGPELVTLDELANPNELRITCEIDGEVMQEASTSDLIFSPAYLIAYVSSIITLVPGDLVLTGTPAGIGGARKPPRYLAPGEIVRVALEGVGELVNECRPESRREA